MRYKCGSCREVSSLSPKAKFCPVCGSSSLILRIQELVEPAQKETVGVYKSATMQDAIFEEVPAIKEEEDRPRLKQR